MIQARFSNIGILAGSIALLLAIAHFWLGPFSKQPSVEELVGEKANKIREAAAAALKGEKYSSPEPVSKMNPDKLAGLSTSLLGGIALILAVIGYAKGEPTRVAGGAAALGGISIAFQFVIIAIGAIVLAILVSVVLSKIGIG